MLVPVYPVSLIHLILSSFADDRNRYGKTQARNDGDTSANGIGGMVRLPLLSLYEDLVDWSLVLRLLLLDAHR